MQGGAGETERLLFGLGATVGSVSQNSIIIRPQYARWKHGWPTAIQTLKSGNSRSCGFCGMLAFVGVWVNCAAQGV